MAKSDGGPAFPQAQHEFRPDINGGRNVVVDLKGGMSLRDWFAGQALGALGWKPDDSSKDAWTNANRRMARNAYAIADAMLVARAGQAEGVE